MKKTFWLTAALALTLAACAEAPSAPSGSAAASSPELDAAIASAEKEIAAAKKTGLWRDTEKHLKAAKEAKAAGKTDEAMKFAKKAAKEAVLAQKQAAAEANPKVVFPK
jgi:hypothetical protein